MARGRELSQLGSLITVDDSTKNIGVATATPSQKIGIGTLSPTSKVEVVGDVSISGVITATSFSGDGSSLTNISVSSANLSVTARSGSVNVTVAAGIVTVFGRSTDTEVSVAF